MQMRKAAWIPVGLACVVGCSNSPAREAPEDPPTLTRRDAEPAGANCAYGGFAIRSGVDEDGSEVLEDDEITGTAYECNPATTMLSRDDTLTPGLQCPGGGIAHQTGIDDNNDGGLQDTEIDQTTLVCNSLEHWRGDFVAAYWSDPVKIAALGGARVVDGSLTISPSASIELPQLEVVHGNVVAEGTTASVVLPALREVDGNFELHAQLLIRLSIPALQRIGGDFSIAINFLASIAAPSLREVGGRLVFGINAHGTVSLPQLSTVSALEDDGGLEALHLDALATVTGDVTISDRGMAGLQLPSLTTIGGDLGIAAAARLAAIDLPALTGVSGDIRFDDVSRLTAVSLPALGRVGGDLVLRSMVGLVALDLDQLTEIAGIFRIETAPDLATLRLPRLRSVDQGGPGASSLAAISTGLREIEIPALTTVSGSITMLGNLDLRTVRLPALTSVAVLRFDQSPVLEAVAAPLVASIGQLHIASAPALTTLDVGSLVEAFSIFMFRCGLADLSPLRALTSIGSLSLQEMDRLHDLRGLSSLQGLRTLTITGHPLLVSLDGLEAVGTGVRSVSISDNAMLASVKGLRSLASLSGSLAVRRNAVLPAIELASLASIGGDLTIADNPAMTALSGLDPLTSVVGTVSVTGNDRIPPGEVAAFLARLGK